MYYTIQNILIHEVKILRLTRVCLYIIIALLFSTAGFSLWAQDEYEEDDIDEYLATPYSLGDQVFSIHLGGLLPLFNYSPDSGETFDPNLTAGWSGYLEWSAFVSQFISIGGNIGANMMETPSEDNLLLIPITIVGTWTYQIYPFDIPIFLRTGLNFTKRNPDLFVGPIIQAGSGLYWNMDSSWAFGLRATYTWVPLFFGPDSNRTDQNRFGNYLELHFGAVYHF
jgi:hypothetical protein